ncbi:hypothetical protein TRAPUB_12868 [Trametes pubescens]|uniref:Ubiquitin-like domain-containing protein n=1 Tax=Trametes pubescens TaxID=154538 RepID=A0A1M2VSW0_TRAPU|nr:hypothetical protein TRAPUB_12868 [Trametes pubescens]
MTEEQQQEDVKPKINLVVDFEGQTCTVKVKPGMPFKKLFEAAEVRRLAVCMDARLTEETL